MTTTIPAARWQRLLERLADELAGKELLADPAWRNVFTSVPRHVFVPAYLTDDEPPRWVTPADAAWLETVYNDTTLATQQSPRAEDPGSLLVTSSSTRPGYMLWMLHLLDVREGMNVLEIGTGTGYNAALLSQRLGDRHVTSIDLDPGLVDAARRHLAAVGHHSLLEAADGRDGFTGNAPYDRIIATVAMEDVPFTWVEQTRPGGIILADLRPPGMIRAGALTKLTVTSAGTAEGNLIDGGVGFMSARTHVAHPGTPAVPPIDKRDICQRESKLSPDALSNPGLAFAVWRQLPGVATFPLPGKLMLTTPDGSWSEVTRTEPVTVQHAGLSDLWTAAEQTAERWHAQGQPDLDSYKITVTSSGTHIDTGLE